jgi:hypothetical protein
MYNPYKEKIKMQLEFDVATVLQMERHTSFGLSKQKFVSEALELYLDYLNRSVVD